MSNTPNVPDHYGATDLRRQVRQALEQSGLRPGSSGWKNIASLDQFHARGLAATEDLAAGMGLIAGETVIDIGCGLGGSSRYLAATFGCHVDFRMPRRRNRSEPTVCRRRPDVG